MMTDLLQDLEPDTDGAVPETLKEQKALFRKVLNDFKQGWKRQP